MAFNRKCTLDRSGFVNIAYSNRTIARLQNVTRIRVAALEEVIEIMSIYM